MDSETLQRPPLSDEKKQLHRLYRDLVDALHQQLEDDTDGRPAIPLELIGYICRLSSFTVPAPLFDVYTQENFRITAFDQRTKRHLWFQTAALSARTLAQLASVKLTTISQHQGWVSSPSQGCWSWFELGIVSGSAESSTSNEAVPASPDSLIKKRADGTMLTWVSHRNPLVQDRNRPWSRIDDGVLFDEEHEIWTQLSPGDCLAVFGCARFPAWSCRGRSAMLLFERYFDPIVDSAREVSESQEESSDSD